VKLYQAPFFNAIRGRRFDAKTFDAVEKLCYTLAGGVVGRLASESHDTPSNALPALSSLTVIA